MFHGYDNSVILREDLLERIRQLFNEIAQSQRRIMESESELLRSEVKKMESQDKETSKTWPWFFLFLAILLIWIGYGLWVYYYISPWSDRGQFGDMFGAVNALFSGLAFAGVIIALVFQRRELELQRRELELTRKELARTASAQEQSFKTSVKQTEIQRQNAILNSIATLIEHFDKRVSMTVGGSPELRRQQVKLVEELQARLESIKQSNVA